MTTIKELKSEVEKTNLTFNEISSATKDFTGFKFLEKPFCTLLKKISDNILIVSFECDDMSNELMLENGIYKIELEDDYIYDVTLLKDNQVII